MVNGLKPVGFALGIGAVTAAGVYLVKKLKEAAATDPVFHTPWGPRPFRWPPEGDSGETGETEETGDDLTDEAVFVNED